MAFKVQVGPTQIAIHQGRTVLVCEPDGTIPFPSEKGLYFNDTRIISSWSLYADGVPWDLLSGGAIDHATLSIHLTNRSLVTASGPVPARTLGLVLNRYIQDGVHEDIDITNHGAVPVRFNLEIGMRCDFADVFEVKSGAAIRRGSVTTDWSAASSRLVTSYTNGDFRRSVSVSPHGDVPMTYANGRLSFVVDLAPGSHWHSCLLYDLGDGTRSYAAPDRCVHDDAPEASALPRWQDQVMGIRTSNEEFYRSFHQAVDDMAALRLPQDDGNGMSFVPAAGLPWFTALFGRDSLIASLQSMIIYPEFAATTLDVLGQLQATERDDYRDAEPGKILHELRFGELAYFKLIPHTPYYGTADATPLYLVALHEAWRWTGDLDLVRRLLPVVEGCLAWIDECGDRDGDGFQEYQTRSSLGYENTAWKDAGDSVPYLDGTLVKGPKALCELQGYVYDAWMRTAELFEALGLLDRGVELRAKAARLHDLFNDVFWDEAGGFYAYCLDGEKRPVLTVASNVGHCLWSGIVRPDRAARVVARLTAPDMWSGWGIRTLSAEHMSYNPYSYQNGSVWPHDNAIIALGFRRYGFAAEAGRVARDLSEAASHFNLNQMPELYAGLQRGPLGFPVQYVGANVPQAWAAGSVFMTLRAMLGLQPDAPNDRLCIDPMLPPWLPDVTLMGLRLGPHSFDIHFWRENDATFHEVVRGDSAMVVGPRPGARPPGRNGGPGQPSDLTRPVT
jgi:glycogen debranching enzyme